MSLTRKLTRPLTRPVAIASGATVESDNVVKSGSYTSFTPTFVGDKSMLFDGTDDKITVPIPLSAPYTISYWIKLLHDGTSVIYNFDSRSASATTGIYVHQQKFSSDHKLRSNYFADSNPISLEEWHHIVVTHDGSTGSLYIDGVLDNAQAGSGGTGGGEICIGARYTNALYGHHGMDEFAVFSSALTAREVDALYNNGQPTNLSSYSTLEAWYRMGEGKLGTKSDGHESLLFDQGPNGGLGSEKITDGGFSDTNNWLKLGPAVVENGVGTFTTSTANQFIIDTGAVPATVAAYKLQYDVVSTNGGTLSLAGGSAAFPNMEIPSSVGTHSVFVTSNGTKTNLQFNNGTSFFGSIDNVSLREVQNAGTINGPRIQADGGTELITNGTYDTDTTGWTAHSYYSTTALSVVSGKLRVTSSTSYGFAYQGFPTRVGGVYSYTVEGTKGTSPNWDAFFGTHFNGAQNVSALAQGFSDSQGTTRTVSGTFTATATTTFITLRSRNQDSLTDAFTDFDNVSVKEVTESVPKKVQNLRPIAPGERSLSFDGTDDFVQFALPTVFNDIGSNDFSVSLWFNSDNLSLASPYTRIFEAAYADVTFAQFNIREAGKPSFYVREGGSHYASVVDSALNTGQWYHLVGVWDASENAAKLYLDGVLQSGTGGNLDAGWGGVQNAFLGCRGGASGFTDGSLDEVAVWDTALDDGDAVKALYNAGQPTHLVVNTGAYDIYKDNLQAYYRVDATNPAADGTSVRLSNSFGNLLFDQTNPGVGSELITNGTFDSDVSNWGTSSGGTVTFSNGTAITGAVGTDDRGGMSQTFTTVNGATYQLTFDVVSRTSTKWEVYRQGTAPGTIIEGTDLGSHSFFFVAAATSTELAFYAKQAGTSDGTVAWDNISVKQVNGHTGIITGATIQTEAPKAIYALPPVDNTKSINFDGTNDHLVTQVDATAQPNNESRYYSFWAKKTTTGTQAVFSHGGWHIGGFLFTNSGPLLYMASAIYQYWSGPCGAAQTDGAWHHWTVKIKYNDITGCELWLDGVKQAKGSSANSGSMNTYSSGIQIGAASQQGSYLNGSIDEFSIHEDLDDEAIRALFNQGRPIDISSGHGAYDLSDKALHWWRMGDASSPAADGTNDIIFQGLEAEGSELITGFTNGSVYPFDTLVTSGRDITSAIETSGNLGAAISNSFPIVTGEVYKVTFNLTYNSGTNTVNVGLRSDATGANVNLSNTYNTNTNGVNEVLLTATGEDSTAHLQFQLGGYSNSVNFSATDISIKRLRGQYIGKELFKADADLYQDSIWTAYGANVKTFPNGTAVRFASPASGGHPAGGTTTLRSGSGAYGLTEIMETGSVYKLQFDFLTDDSDAFPRYYSGSAYTNLSAGSGLKVLYFVPTGAGGVAINVNSLSANKFVQFSNLSLTKVGGAAVMTNMTTSDIQTDTPY